MCLQIRKVSHEGGVNRIRAMRQHPHICASWADTGHVQVQVFLAYGSLLTCYLSLLIKEKTSNTFV